MKPGQPPMIHFFGTEDPFLPGARRFMEASKRQGRSLTPRVERFFDGKSSIKPDKGIYPFRATYQIDAADDITILQLLNHDPKARDVHKPLCFVTVFSGADSSEWYIRRGNQIDSPSLAVVSKADALTVKLQTNGTRWHVWINGKHAASGDFRREGKNTSMRYGAYHHGKGVTKVHVTNATFQLDSTAKMSEQRLPERDHCAMISPSSSEEAKRYFST